MYVVRTHTRTHPPREPGMERNGTEREKNGTVYPYNIRFLPVLLKTGTRATAVLRNGNGKFFVTPTVHVCFFNDFLNVQCSCLCTLITRAAYLQVINWSSTMALLTGQ